MNITAAHRSRWDRFRFVGCVAWFCKCGWDNPDKSTVCGFCGRLRP